MKRPLEVQIIDLFLDLCQYTVSHGYEPMLYPLLWQHVPKDADQWIDEHGNFHVLIGRKVDIMWASHLDTCTYSAPTPVNPQVDWNEDTGEMWCRAGDKAPVLGADCHAGVALMCLMMANNIPGWYVFFTGEESGLIGATGLAEDMDKDPTLPKVSKCVSFDRYGYEDFITHQCGDLSCSAAFARFICDRSPFKWQPSTQGVFTDSYAFIGQIPECTNVPVGYFDQHTHRESQNLTYLVELTKWMIQSSGWRIFELAPTERDPTTCCSLYSSARSSYGKGGSDTFDPDEMDEWDIELEAHELDEWEDWHYQTMERDRVAIEAMADEEDESLRDRLIFMPEGVEVILEDERTEQVRVEGYIT